jgi:CO dehydrogenase/acetyl-CoA synthase beta subunit
MAPLVSRVREFLADREQGTRTFCTPCDLGRLEGEFGFERGRRGETDIILAEDMAVELGHPSTASQAIVLSSHRAGLVDHGRISIVGPDVDEIDAADRRPLGQIVMLGLREAEAPDPFAMDNTQYLIRRLPGYMVRSVPGRLWARIGRKALEAGLTLKTVGSALIAAYTHDFEAVEGAEVVFVTSCAEDVEALGGIANEARILAGQHKKLVLGADGEAECPDLDCESCEDRSLCDELRDIVVKRRRRRQ